MSESNGHDKEFRARSVSIFKKGKVDNDALQSILESMKNVQIETNNNVKKIMADQEAMKAEIKPVINFHRNIRVCAAILTIPVWIMTFGKLGQKFITETLFSNPWT